MIIIARLTLLVTTLTLVALVASGRSLGASDTRVASLSRVASATLGTKVNVYSHQFGCPWDGKHMRGCVDMTAGEAYWGTGKLLLAPDIVAALKSRSLRERPYPLSDAGEAVFTLAHEIGHLSGRPDPGQWEEARADCFASKNWRTLALRLGFTKTQLPTLARQIDVGGGRCWGPYAKGSDL